MHCVTGRTGLLSLLVAVVLVGCTELPNEPPAATAAGGSAATASGSSAEEAAVQKALAYLRQSGTDTSPYDMTKPLSVRPITADSQTGRRIEWRLKPPNQELTTLMVTVWDNGKIDVQHSY